MLSVEWLGQALVSLSASELEGLQTKSRKMPFKIKEGNVFDGQQGDYQGFSVSSPWLRSE